jgi:carbamoyltransferase
MNVLGLHASGPNTAACILVDGTVRGFVEEERFTRVKLASNAIPTRSAGYCLKEARLKLDDVHAITVGWAMNKYPVQMAKFYAERMSHPAKDDYSRIYEQISLSEKDPVYYGRKLEMAFRRAGHHGRFPDVVYHHHHLSHAYSVYYPSPFEEAIILVIDGSGEEMATSVWLGQGDSITFQYSYDLPHSVGYYYAALTEYLGFSVFTGEGKVMGLAPYGKPDKSLRERLDKVMWIEADSYKVDPEYIYFAPRTHSFRHTDKLTQLLGKPPRLPESELTDWHCNLAWETQHKLEQVVHHLVRTAVKRFGTRNLAIAGGVAMNCKMNGFLSNVDEVDRCFVIPASNDAGAALGSAIIQSRHVIGLRDKLRGLTVYTGPESSEAEVIALLKEFKINGYRRMPDDKLFRHVGRRLTEGAIVGWFQGRMEVGARALGNRSILANPAFPDMKDKINREVKHREAFRPFAPAMLAEHAHEYFDIKPAQAYQPYHEWMLQAAQARPGVKEKIPAVVHVDNSIRPQVVSAKSNFRFYRLLQEFHAASGVPVLLNTSFNVRGEPILCKPDEAIRCFYSTGLDMLVLGNIVLEKR